MSHQVTGDPRAQFLSYDTTGKSKIQESAAGKEELEENISLIKDIAPGYGDGFIEACLVTCKGNTQQVANMLLEKKSPEPLKSMDHQMARSARHPSDRTLSETGDPRAAWMGSPTAPPKDVKPDASKEHTPHGISALGDPRAAWLGSDTTGGMLPPTGAHGPSGPHKDTAAEDAEGLYFKTGYPRAQ
ncbi:hypothetical protein WJX75_006425 [Coccomyxa subellipsoidea]|uniref:CUE domain-containing protein n=1 Tax=Coccomyxa subellipsoidea TaxID=248742 RepID=A0ABR2Z085_9CHLO